MIAKMRPLRVVILAGVALGFISILFLAREVLNLADSLLLRMYSNPARLPILWYPEVVEETSRQTCRLCEQLKVNVIYPFETNGLLDTESFFQWTVVSPFLNESSTAVPLSAEIEQLRTKISFDGAAPNVSFVPCIKSSIFLHHGRHFWHSNTLEMFFFLPQEKQELTISQKLNSSFHLLNRPATYELELTAALGFCYEPTELDQYNTQHLEQNPQHQFIGPRIFEPHRIEDRVQGHTSRLFYSLQYSHELAAFMDRLHSNHNDSQPQTETEVFVSSVVSSLPIVVMPFQRPLSTSTDIDPSATASSTIASTASPQSSNTVEDILTTQTTAETDDDALLLGATTASKLRVNPALLPPTEHRQEVSEVDKAEAAMHIEHKVEEIPIEDNKRIQNHIRIDMDSNFHNHNNDSGSSATSPDSDTSKSNNEQSNNHHNSPNNHKPEDTPIIRRRRRLHIDYPTRHTVLSLGNRTTQEAASGVQDAWKLRINVPLAFFQVPHLQLGIEIDAQRFSIALSEEELSRVWTDDHKPADLEATWTQSITSFVQHTGTVTVQTLYQLQQQLQQLQHPQQQLELRIPDFYAEFLRSQTHTAALWMSAQFRHTLHLALPELERGWHQLYVFAVVPRHHLAHRLQAALQSDRKPAVADDKTMVDGEEVVAFDVVQFEVR